MAVPATQGKLCTSLQDMEIGDYIQWHYKANSANVAGEFIDISSGGYEGLNLAELPTTPGSTANGSFYFLKVDKGLLVADRMVQTDISAQALNRKNYLQGRAEGKSLFRCLSQGEWMKYLANNSLGGTIIANSTACWHYVLISGKDYKGLSTNRGGYIITNSNITVIAELNQDIKNNSIVTQFSPGFPIWFSSRTTMNCGPTDGMYSNRGYAEFSFSVIESIHAPVISGYVHTIRASFRPAMEYVDNTNSKNIWY